MGPTDRRDYLERLIAGLEQTIENQKFEIPYYKEGDLQLLYAKKFLAACEDNLAQAKKDLEELHRADASGSNPPQTQP